MTSPKIRRRARECAVQVLFGLEFTAYHCEEVLLDYWADNPSRPGVVEYAERLVRGVCERRAALDDLISGAVDHWNPERIGRVERSIIRVALFEMLHGEDVPETVAINEAIEIAKRFGNDEAPRFVNGVLDRLRAASRAKVKADAPDAE